MEWLTELPMEKYRPHILSSVSRMGGAADLAVGVGIGTIDPTFGPPVRVFVTSGDALFIAQIQPGADAPPAPLLPPVPGLPPMPPAQTTPLFSVSVERVEWSRAPRLVANAHMQGAEAAQLVLNLGGTNIFATDDPPVPRRQPL